MSSFIIRRIAQIIITFLIIVTIVFFLYRLMPGDPTSTIISPKFSPEDRQRLREQFGLDRPLYIQYFKYLNNILRLKFGNSLISGRKVIDIIKERLFPTLLLFLTANILSFAVGKKVGEVMAWFKGRWWEEILTFFTLASYTVFFPWLALILIWIFSFHLGWLPLGGMITPEKWSGGEITLIGKVADIAWHMTLPLLTLVTVRFAGAALVMRSGMLTSLESDFVRTARSKGLTESKVRWHAARNALLPLSSSFLLSFAYSISGSVIVEQVFSWPGLGQIFIQSAVKQDYAVLGFSFTVLAVLVLTMNLIADVAYTFIDPRIKYD